MIKFVIKYGDKAVYLITGFIILIFAAIMIVLFANTGEKIPITCEMLNTKLIDLGYEPSDTTYAYTNQTSALNGSLAIDTGNVRLDFFEFNNDSSASSLFNNSQSQINKSRNATSQDWTSFYNNYVIYSTQSDGIYYIVIRVENTVIDAYCDAQYKYELDTILVDIDYDL